MGFIIETRDVLLELGLASSATDEERDVVKVAIRMAEGAVKKQIRYDPVQRERTEYYPRQNFGSMGASSVWEAEGTQAILRQLSEAATDELQILHLPIRSISTLAIDFDGRSGARSGAFASSTEKTEGTDFWPNYDGQDSSGNKLCRDGIIRSAGSWPTTQGSVKLIYTAGYTALELHGRDEIVDASPIVDAVISEAVRRAQKAFVWMKKEGTGFPAGLVTSESLGDYSVSVDTASANRMFGGSFNLLSENREKLQAFVNWGWAL